MNQEFQEGLEDGQFRVENQRADENSSEGLVGLQIQTGDNSDAKILVQNQPEDVIHYQIGPQLDKGPINIVVFLTLFFKVLGIFIYLFFGWVSSDSTILFVLVMISSAKDFYVTKNISGRFLIGMRWWSEIQENGREIWRYESHEDKFESSGSQKSLFWSSLVVQIVFWGLVSLFNLIGLRLYWFVLSSICLALSFTNLVSYVRCSKGIQNQILKNIRKRQNNMQVISLTSMDSRQQHPVY